MAGTPPICLSGSEISADVMHDGNEAIQWDCHRLSFDTGVTTLRKVNTCKYLPIGSIIILPDDVYKSSKIMLPKEGLCL